MPAAAVPTGPCSSRCHASWASFVFPLSFSTNRSCWRNAPLSFCPRQVACASLRQTVLPQETLGRAAGAFKAAGGGAMLIGALALGALGNAIGVRETLFIAAAGLAIGPLLALTSPALRRVKVIELDAG